MLYPHIGFANVGLRGMRNSFAVDQPQVHSTSIPLRGMDAEVARGRGGRVGYVPLPLGKGWGEAWLVIK